MPALKYCLILLLLLGCGSEQPESQAADADDIVPGPRPSPEALALAVDSFAVRVVADGIAPAFGVGVVMDGKIILSRNYGVVDASSHVPVTDNTLWYVASTSKSFTGFGMALLADQGVVAFRDPIADLLPNAHWPTGFDPSQVTLADFLGHTHGLGDRVITMSASFTAAIPESEWPRMLRFAQLLLSRDVEYSNLGYNVAAMVIDAKRPEGWRRYLDSAVFNPAGMTATTSIISAVNGRQIALPHELRADGSYGVMAFQKVDATMNSAGGHLSTIADLSRWLVLHMEDGVIDGTRVFPSTAISLSHQLIARRDEPTDFAFFRRDGWAAGWDIGAYHGEPMISRFGSYSALRSHLSFLPGRRIGVVTQTNGELGFEATDIAAALVYDLERGDPEARVKASRRLQAIRDSWPRAIANIKASDAKRAARQKPLKHSLLAFAGSYRNELYGTISFDLRGQTLHYQWGPLTGPAEVLDAGQNALRIVIVDNGVSVTFEFPRRGGLATSFELQDQVYVRQ